MVTSTTRHVADQPQTRSTRHGWTCRIPCSPGAIPGGRRSPLCTLGWLLEILIPAAVLWYAGQRDGLFLLAVVVLCLIPLHRAGLTNDLALKASVPGLMILTFYTARALASKPTGRAKWLLIRVFCLGMATPVHHLIVSTYFTLASPSTREKDCIGSYDPRDLRVATLIVIYPISAPIH